MMEDIPIQTQVVPDTTNYNTGSGHGFYNRLLLIFWLKLATMLDQV